MRNLSSLERPKVWQFGSVDKDVPVNHHASVGTSGIIDSRAILAVGLTDRGKTVTFHFSHCPVICSTLTGSTTFDTSAWDSVASQTTGARRQIVLSAVLYGCFTTLVLAALMALLKQRHTHRLTNVALGSTLVLLYASTTTAIIITILEVQANILVAIIDSVVASADFMSITDSFNFGPSNYGSCANTAALTVNILLGDSIVCWRASLLWPGNRVVRGVSIILLLTTFGEDAII
ncbi:hypothetical protein BD309DRAFT_530421 [Dichomitus squalens]|nr:hypothetical protein BD309DRAFT_530421 [Dichomitus squalens]